MSPPRFFLVQAAPSVVEAIDRGRRDPAAGARVLASLALQHQRVAAASERVVDDVRKRPQARDNARFGFAAGNLPYLIAAPDPHGIAEALRTVETLHEEAALEAFFTAQAEKLGLQVRRLDPAIRAPGEAELRSWMEQRLALVAAGAAPGPLARLLGKTPDDAAVRAAAHAAAEILGRIGPVWSEGRGRWLGALAGGVPDAARDAALLASYEIDPAEVRAAFGAPDPQAPVLAALRALVERAPRLGSLAAGPESLLLPAGNAEGIARLLTERWNELGPQAVRFFLTEELDDWRRVILAALHAAHESGVPLLEARDVFRYGYRWPPL